jgi:hypothetical protein
MEEIEEELEENSSNPKENKLAKEITEITRRDTSHQPLGGLFIVQVVVF